MADEPNITPALAQSYRADYAAQYRAPAGATPEQVEAGRTVHLAKFDQAMAADGHTLPTPEQQAAVARAASFGVAHAPDPASFKFELPHALVTTLDTKRLTALAGEMKAWASGSAMDPVVASGILTRLGAVGQEIAALDDAGRVQWHDRHRRMMVGILGQEAYDKAVVDAKYAATEIAQGEAANFGKSIAGGLAIYDPVVLQALSYHGRQHRLWREAT